MYIFDDSEAIFCDDEEFQAYVEREMMKRAYGIGEAEAIMDDWGLFLPEF